MENTTPELKLQTTEQDDVIPVLTAEVVPTLDIETVIKDANTEIAKVEATQVAEPRLNAKEEAVCREFAKKIDITDQTMVLQYGAGAQKHIANFSETALEKVRNKDMGTIGESLSDLVVNLKGFDGSEKKGIFGWFRSSRKTIEKMKQQYTKVEASIDDIVEKLEGHEVTLLKDIAMFGKMFEMNADYFKELTMYIEAGKIALENANAHLDELKKKAAETGATEDAQAASDYANMINRFEKRLYDLELTRTISLQMGPQIRLLQNNDSLMAEKINSSIVNTIPLWKSQMVLALGLENSRQAIAAQKAVTDMTNELLQKNSETLKMGTIQAAKESERGIVEIETLKKTNADLIETIDTVIQIQNEGRAKRKAAEAELQNIEAELKTKLLEVTKK
ncbi:MAG: toxic anion resistance protein [Eubacteriaceae bacterium]|nr:toxic anion resistance protein [Eubacteriaceae bacterium]MBQ1466505.1 toxic anion resistance protein [Eubacteriaceae bacterium]MBR2781674.1 toxic anion resistance protein [Eubacteriaceae bacterium]MCR4894995.1 toxic anion resistance protein [Eubacteriales bacterium]